jgi:hypothetical protein
MDLDWNPVIHVLDTLSEGTHSLLELGYMRQHYKPSAFVESVLYLADRGLVELLAGKGPFEPIPRAEWAGLLRSAFEANDPDQAMMANTSIDLSKSGEQALALFGIGHR